MESNDTIFDLSPTQSAFVHTDAHIAMLMGPMGEGKTYAGIIACMRHSERCGKNIRGALIRDTHQNIKISTVPDIKEILGSRVTFHDDCKKMVIASTPRVEMDLFGIDDPASMSKLQGPQYALIWLEEPAPIIEKANAGLPREVFDISIARAARQKDTMLRVQVSQNPADEDHWTEEVFQMPEIYAEDEVTGLQIIKHTFKIRYGENKYLNPISRLATKAAFKDDPGKTARYVEGRAAPVQRGKAVTSAYNPNVHLSKIELPIIPGAPGVRMYDAWHHPVCIIAQFIPPGKIWIHNIVIEEEIAMQELLVQYAIPLLSTKKFKNKIHDWRDIGDPTMRTPDQSTVTRTTAKVVQDLFKTRFEPGPTRWPYRINPLKSALSSLAPDGEPRILVSKSAYLVHRCLNGGWHWKTDNNGRIIGNVPVKDRFGDVGDALSYGVAVLLPYVWAGKPKKNKTKRNPMGRALSYAPAAQKAVVSGAW